MVIFGAETEKDLIDAVGFVGAEWWRNDRVVAGEK